MTYIALALYLLGMLPSYVMVKELNKTVGEKDVRVVCIFVMLTWPFVSLYALAATFFTKLDS